MLAGGHRNPEEQREKIISVHMVALERAQMNIKRLEQDSQVCVCNEYLMVFLVFLPIS